MVDAARKAYAGLAVLFVLGVLAQFLFAGFNVLGGRSIELHEAWGFAGLHLIPILMFIAAIAGKMGRLTIGLTFLLFVLIFIQPLWIDVDGVSEFEAMHVLMGGVILLFGQHLATLSIRQLRA
jgi:hypothetical protein